MKRDASYYISKLAILKSMNKLHDYQYNNEFIPMITTYHYQIAIYSNNKKERLSHLYYGIKNQPNKALKKLRMILSIFYKTFFTKG